MKDTTTQDKKVYKRKKKKPLICPNCQKGRLIDANADIVTEVRILKEDDPWEADYYAKCSVCKAEVGVRKLNT